MPEILRAPAQARVAIQATVAQFMSKVYLWMVFGLALTALTAYLIASHPAVMQAVVQKKGLFLGLILVQFGVVIALSWAMNRINAATAALLYILYTVVTGVVFSVIFLAYTGKDIQNAFLVTAISFFGLTMFGFVTKRDLGPIGKFCVMGLFGIIGFMLLSFFIPGLRGDTAQMTISALGVIVFAGLTAYDTQAIKQTYLMTDSSGEGVVAKQAIFGALRLYLDFINLFLSILRLFGDRR